jgi:hypothetical protein
MIPIRAQTIIITHFRGTYGPHVVTRETAPSWTIRLQCRWLPNQRWNIWIENNLKWWNGSSSTGVRVRRYFLALKVGRSFHLNYFPPCPFHPSSRPIELSHFSRISTSPSSLIFLLPVYYCFEKHSNRSIWFSAFLHLAITIIETFFFKVSHQNVIIVTVWFVTYSVFCVHSIIRNLIHWFNPLT